MSALWPSRDPTPVSGERDAFCLCCAITSDSFFWLFGNFHQFDHHMSNSTDRDERIHDIAYTMTTSPSLDFVDSDLTPSEYAAAVLQSLSKVR